MSIKLKELFIDIISGEWGEEDVDGNGVSIIRTANFSTDGKVNYENIITRRIIKKTTNENGEEKWVTDEERIERKKLQNGDIIIEKSGGGIGTPVGRVVHFVAPDSRTYLSNNFTQTLRVNKNIVYPRYAFYILRHLYNQGTILKYQNQTTGIFNLKLERYLDEDVFLPPLDIQYSFAAQLDTIQALVDYRIESINTFDKLIESVYFDYFGDSVNNQKDFPEQQIGSLTHKKKPVTRGIENPGQNVPDGIPYIKTSDISNGKIKIKNLSKTSREVSEKHARSLCSTGDLIITIRATIGECAKITEAFNNYNITRGIAVISPNPDLILSDYLLMTILSKGFKFILSKKVKGATFRQINLNVLKDLKIHIPPIELQKEFSAIKDKIDSLRDYQQQSLDALKVLFQAVLQYAFKKGNVIDEQPIFKELIEKFTLDDLKGDKQRLQNLINLFKEHKFNDVKSFSIAKEKLFDLIAEEEIDQVFNNNEMTLQVR